MTYIEPDILSSKLQSPLSTVEKVLVQASEAAQRQNWLDVSNYLKQLPQNKAQKQLKLFVLEAADWEIAFDLALTVLTQADFQHQWEISKIIPELGNKIVAPLTTLLLDETIEVEIRWFVCQILGNFPEQTVVLTLVKLLQQTADEELIAIAGKTLTKIGDNAIPALVDLYHQPQYRYLAVQSLYYIRTAQTIEPLIEIFKDLDGEIRTIAIKALSSFHDSRVASVLVAALKDKASSVRKEAAIALGFRPDLCQELDLISYLQPLLWDLNLDVCRQAAISLGRMKQAEANQVLFKILQAETTPVDLKRDVIKALGWSNIATAIEYLELALRDNSELISQEIITILGRIDSSDLKLQSAQVLISFWQNQHLPSPQIRQALATSLGELRCADAQSTLEQLAADSDRKVQLHALAALNKLR